jgi:hypothetical protein
LVVGGVLGFLCRGWFGNRPEVTLDDVAEYMAQVVNVEEAQYNYNLTRKMLHDANRRVMPRSDSGASARVHRMRKRRVVKRRA